MNTISSIMDIIEAIRTRHSTKSFTSESISQQVLLDLIDSARHSPSGSNKNLWRFVIVTKRNTLNQLSQVQPYCKWLASARVGIAILIDPSLSKYWLEDSSVAAYSIWLSALAHGLGAAWAAMYQSDNNVESERRQQLVREYLSIPANFKIPMVLGIGYPVPQAFERKIPALEEIVYWDNYQ